VCALICGIDRHTMRVRPFLPLGVDTAAAMLDEVTRITKRSVRRNRQDHHTAAAIVCGEDELAGLVEGQLTRPGAPGRFLIDQLQLAVVGIYLERADGAGL